jgi:anti-sigma B factor antagonist
MMPHSRRMNRWSFRSRRIIADGILPTLTLFSARFTVTVVTKLPAERLNMPESSPLTVTPIKDISVVEFTNNKILDESVLEDIRTTLSRLVDAASVPKLLLDFINVDYMSSAALGMLIDVNRRIREKNGQLRLSNIKPQIFEVFVTTKLNKVFRVLADRKAAMESFI